MSILTKRVNDVLDFDFDFTEWLLDRGGDTITSFNISVSNLVKGSESQSNGVVKVFISGGSKDDLCSVVCRINTSGGRTKEVEVTIMVLN